MYVVLKKNMYVLKKNMYIFSKGESKSYLTLLVSNYSFLEPQECIWGLLSPWWPISKHMYILQKNIYIIKKNMYIINKNTYIPCKAYQDFIRLYYRLNIHLWNLVNEL